MRVATEKIPVSTGPGMQIVDVTAALSERLRALGARSGVATVFVSGSTAALTTVEYEPGLVRDLQELFERLAPQGARYHHEGRWHDGNGHSHVRASLLGPSLSIPVVEGKLTLGTWQQVIFVDFDVPARERELVVQYVGE
ncbi:MAG: secondary thiamine-phosphate synthase enzyme YjbQ [Planctomycetales bacterium]|nr:secondary thiamine-phosphate synthase enzyme YjbQ [Planctomycetales bacterium]